MIKNQMESEEVNSNCFMAESKYIFMDCNHDIIIYSWMFDPCNNSHSNLTLDRSTPVSACTAGGS